MYNEICPSNSTSYVVKKGDTLWQLSQFYGVSVQSIMDANPGINTQNLQVGSTICIPVESKQVPVQPQVECTQPTVCPDGTFAYTIKAGDTFWKLSQTYGVSLQSIVDANPGINANNLQVGSTVCIPVATKKKPAPPPTTPKPTVCPDGTFSYTVKAGDTFWKLSQVYGVSVQSIMDANPGVNPDNLQIGSTVCIPAVAMQMPTQPQVKSAQFTKCPDGTFSYTVKAGDTFWKLSQMYGVSLQSLVDANPGVSANNLQVGTTVCIPVATKHMPMQPQVKSEQITKCPYGTFGYTVKAGDTFWKLSRIYGISLQSLVDANPGVPANNLQVGSTICIPAAEKKEPAPSPTIPTLPVTCPDGTFAYTVKAGDSFWKLSQMFGVSMQSIMDANPGVNANNLQVGSTICIPVKAVLPEVTPPKPTEPEVTPPTEILPEPTLPTPATVACPPGTFPYVIEAGDTLLQLSMNFGVSVQSIIEVNPGINVSNLRVGSTICIPIAPETVPAPTAPEVEDSFIYIVKHCDTICGIARKFYVSVDAILMKNPDINPRCLQPGTALKIPLNCCGSNTFRYVVSAGDTLNRIANKFNVCPSAIIAANPYIDFENLVRCQVICIPSR
jgi:peptidoglycan endopeptidase LytF